MTNLINSYVAKRETLVIGNFHVLPAIEVMLGASTVMAILPI